MKKSLITTALIIALLVAGTGFAAERVLTISRSEELSAIDPHNHMNLTCLFLFRLVYGGLTEMSPEGKLIPRLATSWDGSPDAKVWTFHLRKGVKFHNGEPFNAQAVKYTIDRIVNTPEIIAHQFFTKVKETKVVDDYTVEFHLDPGSAEFPANVGEWGKILPPAYSKKNSKDGKQQWPMDQVGTGPFKFVHWIKGEEYVLVKNPDFWGWGNFATTNAEKIVYKKILEPATRMAAIQTGEVDIVEYVPVEMIPQLEADPNIKIMRGPVWDRTWIMIQIDNDKGHDVRVRKAIKYAIDREAIAKYVHGSGRATYNFIPHGISGSNPHLVAYGYNPEKAKQLLAEAGYPNGVDMKLLAPIGWYPKMDLVCAALKEQMAKAGIRVKIALFDGAAYKEHRARKDYDMAITGDAIVAGVPGSWLQLINSDVYFTGWKDAEFARLIDQAMGTVDPEKRFQIYMHIDSLMHERGAFAPFWQIEDISAVQKRVSGIKMHPARYWELYDVKLP